MTATPPISQAGPFKGVRLRSQAIVATIWGGALGVAATACLGLVGGIVSVADRSTRGIALLLFSSLLLALALVVLSRVHPPTRIRAGDAFSSATTALLIMVLGIATLYIIAGATNRLDIALYEAAAGVTTTALGIMDPNTLNRGLLLIRSGSQWLGGLGALILAIAILPSYGAGREFSDRLTHDGRRPLAPNQRIAIRNILILYGPMTLLLGFAYALAGVTPYGALLLALTTASTGGFVGPEDWFNSSSVRWVAIGGMFIAGTSLVVLWRLFVGQGRGLLGSRELRSYSYLVITATGLFILWSNPSAGIDVENSLFTTLSAVTTTGFYTTPTGEWSTGIPALLLLLVAIGPMTGSTGGGFQILRLRILLSAALREMVRQLHPRVIAQVRLGDRVAAEETVRQTTVIQFLFISLLFATAVCLSIVGLDLLTALSAAIHAVATAGPVRTPDGSVVDPASWPRPALLLLVPAMVAGRLFLYPAAVAGGLLLNSIRGRLRLRRRYRRWTGRGTE